MNITFLTSRFYPESRGGAETYTYTIAAALRDRGHEVSVLYAPVWDKPTHDRPYRVDVEDDVYQGLRVHKLRFDWKSAPDRHEYLFGHNPVVGDVISEYLVGREPDVVHVTSCIHLGTAALKVPVDLKLPVVLTLTQYWIVCPLTTLQRSDGAFCRGRQDGMTCLRCMYGETIPLRLIEMLPVAVQRKICAFSKDNPNWVAANSSLSLIGAVERRNRMLVDLASKVHIIAPSRFMVQALISSGLAPSNHVHYSPHGHNLAGSRIGAKKTQSDGLRFGFTGNVIPMKGVHLAVEAFKRIPVSLQARLLVYGDTDVDVDYGDYVRRLADDHPGIQFMGRFDQSEIWQILQGIDVLLVPSTCFENAPVTISEAFSAETPVIASGQGGMAEMVEHGVSGLLFRPNDVDDLAIQMRNLIEDASLVDTLRAGCPTVRTVDDEVYHLLELYNRLSCLS